jgi:hypothetical protein
VRAVVAAGSLGALLAQVRRGTHINERCGRKGLDELGQRGVVGINVCLGASIEAAEHKGRNKNFC